MPIAIFIVAQKIGLRKAFLQNCEKSYKIIEREGRTFGDRQREDPMNISDLELVKNCQHPYLAASYKKLGLGNGLAFLRGKFDYKLAAKVVFIGKI